MRASSGDLLADRRLDDARALLEEGDTAAALDLARQVLERAPGWSAALFLCGEAHERQGEPAEAARAFHAACAADPADTLGAGLRAARLDAGSPAMPPAYVAALFDDYAPRFDAHLASLGYCAPALLRALVDRVRSGPARFARALDLGCGTGLAAHAFADRMDACDGVDLSPRMVALARATGLYRTLEAGDLGAFLAARPAGGADLVLAADVFVYCGDLTGIIQAAARALAPGGLLAFTTQRRDAGDGFALGADLRFAHSAAYLRLCAAQAGLEAAALEEASSRQDAGAAVPGLVCVLARP